MITSLLRSTAVGLALVLGGLLQSDRALAAGCATPGFVAAGTFTAGFQPVDVAVGDLNGDGKADLVVANQFSADVSILLGNGNGTFQTAVSYPAGSGPSSVALAHFNGDGRLDIVVSDVGSTMVWVLMGNGNGTFQPAVGYDVGNLSQFVGTGDFNLDGKIDLAVVIRVAGTVSVMFGNGNGTFNTPSDYLVGADPFSLAVADFNKDGPPDLAVANAALFDDTVSSISILKGRSTGSFQNAVDYAAGTSPRAIAVGDFNGDGNPDMAVANYGAFPNGMPPFTNSSVSILLGAGNGTFPAPVNLQAGEGCLSLVATDLNGDGKLDLAVMNYRSSSVSILYGNGNGTFAPALHYNTGANPHMIAVGEFNGDGMPDLVVAIDAGAQLMLSSCVSGDMAIGMTGSPASAVSGDAVTYTLNVTNNGPNTALAATLTNRVPAGMSFSSVTTTLGTCTNASGAVGCGFGNMASGVTATVTITMTATATGNITNIATVASSTLDQVVSNNTARVATTILPLVSISAPDPTATEAGPTTGFFSVSRSGSAAGALTVNYTVSGSASNGVDYSALSGSVTIPNGAVSTTITVTPVNDPDPEPSETVVLTLSANAAYAVNPSSGTATVTIIDNDFYAISVGDATVTEGDSGAVQAVFTVSLSPARNQPVTVEFTTADGTASAGSDYVATNGLVTFDPGTTNQSVIVTVIGDLFNEANETFFVNLSNATNGMITDGQGMGTINNNDPLPSLSIDDVTMTEGNSGTSSAVFTVSLSALSGQTVSLAFATANGTAQAGGDYTAANGVLSFPPGTTNRSVTVLISGDGLNEANETFFVNLSNPTNATLTDAQGLGTINNDDPLPGLSIDDVTLTEGNSGAANAVFTVRLSTASGQTVSANFATANGTASAGSDYVATNGTVSFAPGVTTQTIPARVNGDVLNEPDETFLIDLSGAVNATVIDSQAVGTILNDDPLPTFSISDVTVTEGDSGTTDAVFNVRLSAASGQSVTVNFATADGTASAGSDYMATNGTLTFAPGLTNLPVAVKVNGELFNEANETFFLNLSNPTNALLADAQGLGTINNNDPLPGLSINDVAVTEGDSGTVNAVFTVSLSAVSGQTVTANFATADGTAAVGNDYVAANGTVSFPPGTTTQPITVQVIGDLLNELDETFFVNLSNPGNALLTDAQGVGTISNNDPLPSLSINNVAVKEGDSGTTNAVFTVSLSAASGRTVVVDFATADGTALDGSDYAGANGTLTFAPGIGAQTITIQINGDEINEINETYFVNLSSAVNATLGDSSGLGTILDDDSPTISISDVSVTEGNAGATNAVFTLSLSYASALPASINFSTANGTAASGSDYVATNGIVNFPPGTTNQTLTVRVNGDVLSESNETFFVNLSNPTNTIIAEGQGVGTINDEDPLPALSILDVAVTEGNSGTANAVFNVRLSLASGQEVMVNFATADGMASAGSDYIATNGTVTFPPGITNQTVAVAVIGDLMNESNETFFVNLSNPFRASLGDSQGVGTINNNDPVVGIGISDAAVFEGNSGTVNMVFTLSLSAVSGQAVTVTYATADGTASRQSDYVRIVSGVARFDPGQTNQTITVVVNGDTASEPNETLFVNLSSPVNANLLDSQAQGTILNDEGLPSIAISDATVVEGNSGVVNAVFNVQLSASSSQVINVGYSTADGTATAGSDYVGTNGNLSFAPGTTSQTITVRVLGDLLNEVNETFFVNLAFSTNAPISDGQGLGTINNDDPLPSLAIDDVTVTEASPGITNALFTVSLSAASGQTVTVNFATADGTASAGSDYVATNGVLSFAPGTSTRTIAVLVNGDMEMESTESFFVNLSGAANATLGDSQAVGTILNGQSLPAASISDATVTEGNSGPVSAVFTVSLSFAPSQEVTLNFSTANGTAVAGSDYVATNGLMSFAPGTTNQTVSVTVLGESINESNEVFFLNLSNPTNALISDGQGMGTINNDDPLPSLSISDVTVTEGNSGTTNAVFTVSLSPASGQTVTVNFASADGSANAGSDYAATNGTLSFAPGATTRTITVPVNGDVITENNETFLVSLSGAVNAILGDSQGVGTILNDDVLPTLSIGNATVNEGDTGSTNAVFAVSLSSSYPQTVTVSYATANGTATAGSDYGATNGIVTFAPGSTSQSISVRIIGDRLNEPSETFFVNLSNPTNASIADGRGLGTISNDDPLPTLSIGDVSLAEGDSGTTDAGFAVTLSAASGQTVTVSFATANGTATAGSDYVGTNGVLTFTAGVTNQTLTVKVIGDLLGESNETFFVNLSNPSNATLADGQGQGTIFDDESLPSIFISDVTVTEGNAGATSAVFTVRLSFPYPEMVSVDFSTANGSASSGSDYVATNGLLNFDPGMTNQSITVMVLGDAINEGNETFFVNLSNPTNAVIADGQGRGTIDNDDPLPNLSINDVTVTEGNSGSINAVFTVSLSPASGQTVTVNFASADGTATAGSDYAAANGTLTFAPGATTQTLAVSVNGDTLNEANETFFVNLSGASNALIGDSQGVGNISNDDALPTLSISDAAVVEGNSGTTNAVFTVSLSAVSDQTVTVNFTTADGTASAGSDYASTNGSLTFPPGTTAQTITVRVNGDLLTEPNETFFVNLTIALNADISDNQGLGTITNDDLPAVSINDVTVTEGNTGITNAVFTVSLSAASGQTATINYATADGTALAGSDYFPTNGTLTFAPGTVTQTVTVRVIGDAVFETSETFFVNLSSPANATLADGQGVGTISNNDSLPALFINDVAVTEGNSGAINATFTVRLSAFSSQPVTVDFSTANGTASSGADFVSTNGTVTFPPGTTNQTLSVTVLGDLSNESNETYFVNLSNPAGATISDGQGLGTINNDDSVPSIFISDAGVFEGNSGTTNIVFRLSLSAASGQQVSVSYATSDGTASRQSDYTRIVTALAVFSPGQTTQTVSVTVSGDTTVEDNETFFVDLSNPTNATVADNQAVGLILNDDGVPSVFIADATVAEGNSGTTNAVFNVRLSASSAQTVTVGFSTADGTALAGSDYLATNGVLSFAPGSTNQTITVRALGDLLNEPNESFFVNLTSSTNALISDGQAVGTISNDDPLPGLFIDDVAVIEGDAGTTSAQFNVRLSAPSGRAVTVSFATADGTALAGSDYLSANGTLNFAPGTTNQTVLVTVLGDVLNEASESFSVNLSAPVNATISDGQAVGTISNDDPLPTLSIANVSVVEGDSGTTNAIFIVSLSPVSGQMVSVDYATSDGTAQAGGDYIATNGTLNFAPGTTTQTVTVVVRGDLLNEAGETFLVNLSNAVNANLAGNSGLGTILNDDPLPALTIGDASVVEGDSGSTNAIFTVNLSVASGQNVTVNFAAADGTATAGSDYIGTNGSLNFAPGVTSRTIVVPVLGDVFNEANENFSVILSAPVNTTISDGLGLGTINNDDPLPALIVSDVTVTEGDSGTSDAVFTVSLSAVSGQTVTVNYATANGTALAGSDYIATNGSVSFLPGTTTQPVIVKVIGDLFNELDETFLLNLSNPGNATLADDSGLGTIVNNDSLPALSLGDASVVEGNSGATAMVFTVSLSTASGRTITVNFATANATALAGVDYVSTNGTISLAPGTTSQTIAVMVLGDTLDEVNESFSLSLSGPVNATINDGLGVGTINDDDPSPALSVNDVAVIEGDSGAVQATFIVSLSAASGRNVSVGFSMSDGTATSGSDYVATSGSLNFPPGTTTQSVPVTILGDLLNEANESFFLNLAIPVNATISDGQGVGTINDDDPMPELAIADVAVTEGDSGTTDAVLTLTLSAVSGQIVTVDYATTNGTAIAGLDYIATNGTVSFDPGVTVQTITVKVNGDVFNEVAETLFVNLSEPGNANLTDSQGEVTILNDDPLPTLAIHDATVTEGNSGTANALFQVSLSVASGQTVTVRYATADGTATAGADYMATNGIVTFAPGTTNQTIAVGVLGDLLNEPSETFFVNLSNPTNAVLGNSEAMGAIDNNDPLPALAITDVTVTEGDSGTTDALFTISLSAASGQTVTVNFATADGTAVAGADYLATNGAVTFAPGTTTQGILVKVVGELLNESSETFFVNLSGAVNATLGDGQGRGTINNDDPLPTLSVGDAMVMEGDSGTTTSVFTVSLSAMSGQMVTANYATANGTAVAGTDYVSTNGIISIAPGTTAQTITVRINGDLLSEADETFFVSLSSPTNATLSDAQGTGTINNDDPLPSLSINNVTIAEGNSGTTNAVFTVSLSAMSGQTVTVNYASSNGTASAGSDYISTNGTLSFAPGVITQSVTVRVNGDLLSEANETFFVNLTDPANATLGVSQGVGTINDNDTAPALFINDIVINEGNSGATNALFTVRLAIASGQPVTVNYATANGTAIAEADFISTNGTVSFPPGSTNQTIAVAVLGDLSFEANETFVVNLSNPANAIISDGQGIGTINNDDPVPSIFISDAAVFEGNSGTTNIDFTLSLSVVSGQPVTVSYATSDGTASRQSDYTRIVTSSVVFNPGQSNQTISVTVNGDTTVESNETFFVDLSNPINATLGDSQAQGLILNDDGVPFIFIGDATVTEGNSGTTNANFTVRLSAAYAQAVTMSYATADGTAVAGSDYVGTNGTLNFPAGTTNQTITVRVLGDVVNEVNETFFVNLSNSTNALISDGVGLGTIVDNDALNLVISTNAISVPEGGANSFAVRLNTQPTSNVVVTARFSSGDTNLAVSAGASLVFNAANWNVDQSVVIGASEDDDAAGGQALFTISAVGLPDRTVTASELDNDTQALVVTSGQNYGAAPRITGIQLAGIDTVIHFTTVLSNSYRLERSTEVAGSPWTIVADNVVGTGGIAQVVDSGGASQARRFYRIRLMNVPGVSIAVPEGGSGSFTVRLAAQPTNTVIVAVARTSGSTNLSVSTGSSLTFNPSNWNVPQTVIVNAAEDANTTDDDATVTISSPGLPSQSVNVTVLDNDLQGFIKCPGDAVVLSAMSSGAASFNFLWSKDGVPLAGQTNGSLVLTNLMAADAGTYSVQISGDSYTLTKAGTLVMNLPTTATQFSSKAHCPGESATFSTVPAGSGPFTYQWSKDAMMLNGATNGTLVLPNLSALDAGDYCVVVSGACNRVTNCVSLTVSVPVSATGPPSTTNCQGMAASLSVTARGSGLFVYQWAKDGVDLPGQTSSNLVLPNLTAAAAGNYCVVVSGVCNRVTNCASLTVLTPLSATGPVGQTQCLGATASFTVAAGGSGPLSYQWSKAGANLPGATNNTLLLPNVSALDAGSYCVVVSGPCNRVTNCASLTVLTPLSATGPVGQTLCPGGTASFTVAASGSGPLTYQWSKAGADLPGATNNTLLVPNVSALDAASYCVVVSGPCNRVTNCASLTVLTPLSATGPAGQTLCPGATASFSVAATGSGPLTYQWSKAGADLPGATNNVLLLPNVSALDTSSYCVVISGPCNRVTNCASLIVLTPVSATGPVGQTLCPGATASFSVAATGSGPLSYQWSKAGADLPGATNNTLLVPNVSSLDAASYCVVVNGPCDRVTNCATLTVLTRLSATGPVAQTLCPGATATFSIAASGSGPLTYQWSKAGADLPGATNNTLLVPNVSSLDAGSYCVVVSGPCNRVTNCASLTVLTRVSAIGPVDQTHCPGDPVAFSVAASGSGPLSYQWSRGGVDLPGATSDTLVLPSVAVADTGTYCVAVHGACNSLTNCATLTVTPPPTITSQPTNQLVYVNSNATFDVTASGTGSLSYQWRFNGAELPGETASMLTVVNSQPANEGAYSVVVLDGICSVTSTVATLNLFRDFGDAPAPTYPTLLAANGARHLIVPGFHLGARIDAESDGQPTSSANGDDLNEGPNDEDGVTFLTPVIPGLIVSLQVVASADGRLDGWLDFNGNGSWADPEDRIFNDEAVSVGINLLTFQVPINAVLANTFARFRFGSVGGLAFNGQAGDGEVEDYSVDLVPILPLPIPLAMAGEQDSVTVDPPRLTFNMPDPIIAGGRAGLTISWPLPSIGFVLESATNLSPSDWQPASELPIIVNDRWEVSVPIDQVQRYFRLRKL